MTINNNLNLVHFVNFSLRMRKISFAVLNANSQYNSSTASLWVCCIQQSFLSYQRKIPEIKSSCRMTRNNVFNSVYHVNFSLRVRKIIFVVDNANSFTSRTGSSRVKQTPPTARFFNIWQPGAPIYQFYVHLNIKCCSVSFSAGRQLSVSFFLTLVCLVATTYQNDFSY